MYILIELKQNTKIFTRYYYYKIVYIINIITNIIFNTDK